jgi:hypothetical protein
VDSGTLLSSLSSYLERLARSLIDGVLNLLGGLLGGVQDALNQGLQSFPAGTIPASGSGLSVGSGSGFSGSSRDDYMAILALLAMLLLSGKFLWSAPEFLRPNSALRLVTERPG